MNDEPAHDRRTLNLRLLAAIAVVLLAVAATFFLETPSVRPVAAGPDSHASTTAPEERSTGNDARSLGTDREPIEKTVESEPSATPSLETGATVVVEVSLGDRAASGVSVFLSDGRDVAYLRTANDGRALFRNPDPGDYQVGVLGLSESRRIAVEQGRRYHERFEIAGRSATVRVVSSSGEPIAGSEVWCSSSPLVPAHLVGVTGVDGTFVFRPLSTLLHVEACADGFARSGLVAFKGDTTLILQPGGAAIRGRVFDQHSGVGIAGASVSLDCRGATMYVEQGDSWVPAYGPIRTTTSKEGEFFFSGLNTAALVICVDGPGSYPDASVTAVLAQGEEVEVAIPLELGERIDGEVVNESGEGVEGAAVLAWGDQRTPLARGISGLAGHFSLEGVPRAATAIEAMHSSQGVGRAELQRGGHDVVEIRLDPSTLVAGRLTLSDGEPVHNARVAFWDRREGLPSSYHSGAKTDALGRFSFLCHPCEKDEVEIAAMLVGSQFPISTWSVAVGEQGLDLRIEPHRISLGTVALSTLGRPRWSKRAPSLTSHCCRRETTIVSCSGTSRRASTRSMSGQNRSWHCS